MTNLGDFHVSGLGRAFEGTSPAKVVKNHLSDVRWKLFDIHADVYTTETLIPHVTNAVDKPIIESSQFSGNAMDDLISQSGMRVGDLTLSFADGKYTTHTFDQHWGQVLLDEYAVLPSQEGSLIIVSTTQPLRYRATVDEDGLPHVYHESVRTISEDDASRFKAYGEDLKTYKDLLWRAIDETRVDISPVKVKFERKERFESDDYDLLDEASKSIRDYYAAHSCPVVDQMEMQAGLIMAARNQDTFTTAGRSQSMYAVSRKIRAYFETVNIEGLSRNYDFEVK